MFRTATTSGRKHVGTVCTAAPLGNMGLGSFGFNTERRPDAYATALGTIADPRAFARVRTLERATCVDCRLGLGCVRHDLAHMPGGGMTLALMEHFAHGGLRREASRFHFDCKALAGGVKMVKEILQYPNAELELLWRLDIATEEDTVMLEILQDWAWNGLPDTFLDGVEPQERLKGNPNPIMAVLNRSRDGFTLRQDVFARRTGYEAFSFDLWAAQPLAERFATSQSGYDCLVLLYQLLSAGTLRRVGSELLAVAVV